MSSLLSCKQVNKSYLEGEVATQVLNGVTFEMQTGELAAIIGTSGSGKSTLLHILGTLDKPCSGEVFFKTQNISELSSKQKADLRNQELGFIYQFHHLLSDFSARENVAMPLLIAGKPKQQALEAADQLLEKVGLSHRLTHRPSEISGGERQRVAIARALVNRPALVLADEPTGNLDHKTALTIYELMRELNQEFGTAFLVVTHDTELASKMDTQFHMRDGLLARNSEDLIDDSRDLAPEVNA